MRAQRPAATFSGEGRNILANPAQSSARSSFQINDLDLDQHDLMGDISRFFDHGRGRAVFLVRQAHRPLDQRLALAADVDEEGLLADLEDASLDDLSDLQRPLGPFARKQRREMLDAVVQAN
jgi:hypothetical protein